MSLINDALKKAQRQRGDEPGGDQPVSPGSGRVARREKPAGFQALLLRIGIGVITVCAIIVTTVLLVRRDGAPPAPVPPVAKTDPLVPTNPPAPAPKTDPAVTAPVAPKTETPPVTVAANNPPVTTPANPPVAAPIVAPATPTISAAANAPVAPPASTGPIAVPDLTLPPVADTPRIPAPTTAAEQDKRILSYLANLRVNMIRPAGADSKVLMNDRVYRLNDIVEYTLGLKITGIAYQRLEFVDERGVGYVKQF